MHFYLITDDLMIDIVGNPLPLSTGGGGLNHLPSFQKGGLDRTLIFKGGWLERGGGDLFEGDWNEILNDKNVYKQKCFSLS